jgi:hypothetical protein
MPRASILDEIRALDPEADHARIVFLCSCYDFAFEATRALEFALYRTYCVPSISALLDRTGEFQHRFTESNQRVGAATRDLFLSWFPAPFRPLVRPAIYALMDDPLLDAFGFPKPRAATRQLVLGLMQLRARLLRVLPPRRAPRLRTAMARPTYPRGYAIEHIGPAAPKGEGS